MSDANSGESAGAALRNLVAKVAAGYFANSRVSPSEIPTVIAQIAASLSNVGEGVGEQVSAEEAAAPKRSRAQIRKSITPDALISFEDNRPYKTLRRHLAARGLTPGDYRAKWGLPSDYPMVSPSYSAARSEMAKSLGLGQRGQAARTKRSNGRRKPKPAAKA